MKISDTMQAALDKAKAGDGRLYRWPGGYWTDHQVPVERHRAVPDWYVGTKTIWALFDRGLVAITERMRRGDPLVVRVND